MDEELLNRLATCISRFTNPFLVIWPFSFIILKLSGLSLFETMKWVLIGGWITVLPLATYIYYSPKYESLTPNDRNLRNRLYVIGFVEMLVLYAVMLLLEIPPAFREAYLGLLATFVLAGIVNRFRKISVHVGIFTAFSIMVFAFIPITLPIFLFLIGLVAWSRFQLDRHEPVELLLGFFVPAAIITATLLLVN